MLKSRRCLLAAAAGWILAAWAVPAADAAENLFGNPSFENGRDEWHLGRSGKTAAQFTVDEKEAAAGQRSALIRMGAVDGWGVQFGQTMEAPERGKTYTFAVLAKSVKGPVTLRLEIERRADPYDRAAATPPQTVTKDKWTELHVTFKIDKPFPQGWFAYVSCNQRDAEFRLDMFRLVEGDYVPYEKAAREEIAAAAVTLFDTAETSPAPLTGQAILARKGWLPLARGHNRPSLSRRRGAHERSPGFGASPRGRGAELYGQGSAGAVLRAVLSPATEQPALRLQAVAVVTSDPGEAAVDATFQSAGGGKITIRYDLAMGQTFVKTEPREGARGLNVEAPCRFLVLPDFFADDIVIDAADIPMATAEVPSENFLLHLLPDRQAIVMAVANNRSEDARIDSQRTRERKARPLQPDDVRQGRQDLGGRPPGSRGLASARRDQGGGGQNPRAGLDGAVFCPVAHRLAMAWPVDRQLGDGGANDKRRVPQVWLVRLARHAARRSQALDHGIGQFSLSLLVGPWPPRISPTVDPTGSVRGSGRDLPHPACQRYAVA